MGFPERAQRVLRLRQPDEGTDDRQQDPQSGDADQAHGQKPRGCRIADDQVTVVWSVPESGKLIDITMKGKISGDLITGTAQLGDVGEGALSARRTAE